MPTDPQCEPEPQVCAHGATADEGCPVCDPAEEAWREWVAAVIAQAETIVFGEVVADYPHADGGF